MSIKEYYDDQQEAAQEIKNARLRAGMTQEDVAVQLGVSQSYISQLENGRRPISRRTLQILGSLYNSDNRYVIYSIDDLEKTYDLIEYLEGEVQRWIKRCEELEARNGD